MSAQAAGAEEGPVRPEDVEVSLAVRRELGPDHDQAVIGEFLDRVGSAIDERVDARVQARASLVPGPAPDPVPARPPSIALGIMSLLAGVACTAIALGVTAGSLGGIILTGVCWAAIAVVNAAYTRRR
jgi:hypothetical protein